MNIVYLVGAGCGAGSLTLRGAELVRTCDCIVYDSLIDEEILTMAKPSCRLICAGKRAGAHGMRQDEICRLLAECGKKYRRTVRLKGGDPFVFGRGGEEMLALREAGVCAESVPGVTSAVAAAEYAGIPVTHRGLARGFRVLTAHTAEGAPDFSALAKEEDTLVFLMGKGCAAEIRRGLIQGGMAEDMPAALISEAGTPSFSAKRCLLRELDAAAEDMPPPLAIVVGRVCALGAEFCRGPRVVVTGTPAHVARVLPHMRAAGMDAAGCPHMRTVPYDFDWFFRELPRMRMLVFTSANGVRIFFERARTLKTDARAFGDKKFAAIGRATAAELEKYGFYADVVPQQYTAAALAEELAKTQIPEEETALLRSASGSRVLSACGRQIDLYDTQADGEVLRRAEEIVKGADAVTFSSAGGARALLARCALPEGAAAVAIGEETARALRQMGYAPAVADNADAEELAAAVLSAKEMKK